MKTKIYVVEVGVQQDGTEQEFEDYILKGTQPKSEYFNFYDENVCVFLDKRKAKKYADKYVKDGVTQTYAYMYNNIENLIKEDMQNIKEYATYNDFDYYIPKSNEMDYYIYKNNNKKIKKLINRL